MIGGWPVPRRDHRVATTGQSGIGLLLQRMLRLPNYFTAEELTSNIVHLEQFK